MTNYISADLKRIFKRVPRLIVLAAVYAGFIIYLAASGAGKGRGSDYISLSNQYLANMLPLLFGVIELISVFSEDFRAKTMQIAIGRGMERWQVVLCKFFELCILVVIDLLMMGIVVWIAGIFMSTGLSSGNIGDLFIDLFSVWLSVISYGSLTMILIFYMQGTGTSIFLYLLLASNILGILLDLLFTLPALSSMNIDSFLLTGLLDDFTTALMKGSFSFPEFLGICAYTAAGLLFTTVLFEKRELEF